MQFIPETIHLPKSQNEKTKSTDSKYEYLNKT